MKFQFEQTAEDVKDLSIHLLKGNRPVKIILIFFGVMIFLNIISSSFRTSFSLESILSWIIPVAIIILIWVFIYKTFMNRAIANSGNKKLLIGSREIELSADEIKVKSPISETSIQWSAITKLKESKRSYFLFMGKIQAIIIPKRVFESEEGKKKFEEFVSERIGG